MISDVRQIVELSEAPVAADGPPLIPVCSATDGGGSLQVWLARHRDEVRGHLLSAGAVLLRGFSELQPGDVSAISVELTGTTFSYNERTTPRRQLARHAYTATEYPADQEIFLHNENAYASQWPAYLYFYCERPAAAGGETTMADLTKVQAAIPRQIQETLQRRGLVHRRTFRRNLGLSWQEAFGITSFEMLQAFCGREGYRVAACDDDCVVLDYPHSPLARNPADGAIRWFNHAAFFQPDGVDPATRSAIELLYGEEGFPNRMLYGDLQPLEPEIVCQLRKAYSDATTGHRWQRHDLLVLDNMRHAHGRRPFSGARSVWVVMSGQCFRRDCLP